MKIIGIKLEYGEPSVIKNLHPGWFPFGDYQEPEANNKWQYIKADQKDDSDYLSKMYKSVAPEGFPTGMQLSVQCIVGKNGSGKSTLLELYYRIINDFACKCIKEKWTEWGNMPKDLQLEESKGYSAKLFFETNDKLQYLYRHEHKMEYVVIEKGYPRKLFDSDCSLYGTDELSKILHSFFYTIANNYSLYSLNPDDYNKNRIWGNNNYLEETDGKWLECVFHKNDGYLTPLVMVPFRDKTGNVDRVNEDLLAKQRLSTLAILFESQGFSLLEDYHPKKLKYRINRRTDYQDKGKNIIVSEKATEIFLGCFDYTPNYSEFLKSLIKKTLDKHKDDIYRLIKGEWSYYLSFNNNQHISQNFFKIDDFISKNIILDYLTYKTIKIIFTYPSYSHILLPQGSIKTDGLLGSITKTDILLGSITQIIKKIDNQSVMNLIRHITLPDNTSHITLKIRQCLAFIARNFYKIDNNIIHTQCSINNNTTNSFLSKNYAIDKKLIGEDRKKIGYKTYEEVFLRMPPSFFEWELFFGNDNSKKGTETNGNEELTTFSQMSSGERHDLVSTSYLMYHLTNLQSVRSDRFRIPYHHINLIFDEVELYFHPEYQRKYLANLLKTISQCHISGEVIQSINIIIVTHSPFILSDVPLSHTLYLENGTAKARKDETFSANIHNLLVNQFFIEQPMGEVAANIIEEIAGAEEINIKEEYDYYMFIAKKVGDPYISNRLVNIIESKAKDIVRLREEQKRLERRLEEIKYQLNEGNKK